jgi:pimeloyl-ACP methyl ester carboxylesterase
MPGGPNLKPERGPLEPGTVAAEAAAIRCPVLIANGERDVCPDPRAEPAAYASSPDITTYVLPNAAHMHNFASTRALLWARLDEWARTVAATKRRSANPSS